MNNKRKAEQKIIKRIVRYGGATVFWITHSRAVAEAMDYLESSGRVVRLRDHPRDRYPYCVYAIRTKNLKPYVKNRNLSLRQWQVEYLGDPTVDGTQK